jgi:Holliday junction DNA helicase RuvA
MIGRLTGTLVDDQPTGEFLIDVGGVGYQVSAPVGAASRLKARADANGHVTVFVHTHVRAEAFDLYGFSAASEREVFRHLINVPNVGPRTALSVLGALPVPDLVRAVSEGNVRVLHKVPGIGKKTAERLVLELKEKLLEVRPGEAPVAASGNRAKLTTALTNMGYRPAEAERTVKGLEDRLDTEPLATLLREALQSLSP